jgi:hypothetical protein
MILENTTYQTITDSTDANNVYYGYAELWRATWESYWKIKKKTTAWSIVTEYYPLYNRYPNDWFVFEWDERANYVYSLTADLTKPTLSTVTIESDNSNTAFAKVGDTITLTIVSSEDLQTPVVTILWEDATIITWVDDKNWTATYEIVWTETNWTATFTINFTDIAWNIGTQVTTTTDSSEVTVDTTSPFMESAERLSNTVLKVFLSEDADDATLTQANDGWFVVFETWTPATTYAVSATAKSWSNSDQIELTVADVTASASIWLTVTYSSAWNWIIADPLWNEMATDNTWVLISAWA